MGSKLKQAAVQGLAQLVKRTHDPEAKATLQAATRYIAELRQQKARLQSELTQALGTITHLNERCIALTEETRQTIRENESLQSKLISQRTKNERREREWRTTQFPSLMEQPEPADGVYDDFAAFCYLTDVVYPRFADNPPVPEIITVADHKGYCVAFKLSQFVNHPADDNGMLWMMRWVTWLHCLKIPVGIHFSWKIHIRDDDKRVTQRLRKRITKLLMPTIKQLEQTLPNSPHVLGNAGPLMPSKPVPDILGAFKRMKRKADES